MSSRWIFIRAGEQQGPFSKDQLELLVQNRVLLSWDLLWEEGDNIHFARFADEILDFAALQQRVPAAAPPWLEDVRQQVEYNPSKTLKHTHQIPSWLDDIREVENLPERKTAGKKAPASPDIPAMKEKKPESPPPPFHDIPPIPAAPPHAVPTSLASAIPASQADPTHPSTIKSEGRPTTSKPIAPTVPSPPPTLSPLAAPQKEGPPTTSKPLTSVVPSVPTSLEKPLPPSSVAPPEVGKPDPVSPTETMFTVFRKAQSAINIWLDEDANIPLILTTNLQELVQAPELQKIIQMVSPFGPALVSKISDYFRFTAQNRRAYYQAMAKRNLSY